MTTVHIGSLDPSRSNHVVLIPKVLNKIICVNVVCVLTRILPISKFLPLATSFLAS